MFAGAPTSIECHIKTEIGDVLTGTEHVAHWFFRLLHGSLVANATGQYRDFDEIAVEAARAVAEKQGRSFGQREATRVKQAFLSLPVAITATQEDAGSGWCPLLVKYQ